jgi:signal transduction histidine kinase
MQPNDSQHIPSEPDIAKETLPSFFDACPARVLALDTDLRVIAVTDLFLEHANIERQRVLGQPFSNLLPFNIVSNLDSIRALLGSLANQDVQGPISMQLHSALEHVSAWRMECRTMQESSGKVRAVMVRIDPHPLIDSENISSLRDQRVELLRSNQELEQFAYVASHDLQEPLRMIISHLQILQRRYRSLFDDRALENMAFVTQAAERMRMMVTAILEFSRIGSQEPVLKAVDSGQCLSAALKNLAPKIAIAGAAVERISTPIMPTVQADPIHLVRIFQNLIGNALKFHGESAPYVRIQAVEESSSWRFSIADNGVGIPAENQGRLFRLFERAHRDQFQGSGIGLAVCKRLVEHHGGRIWFDSRDGIGSTFFFTIPKASDDT